MNCRARPAITLQAAPSVFGERSDLIAVNYADCLDVRAAPSDAVGNTFQVQGVVQHSFHLEGADTSSALIEQAATSIWVKATASEPALGLCELPETSYLDSIRNGMLYAYSHRAWKGMVGIELS